MQSLSEVVQPNTQPTLSAGHSTSVNLAGGVIAEDLSNVVLEAGKKTSKKTGKKQTKRSPKKSAKKSKKTRSGKAKSHRKSPKKSLTLSRIRKMSTNAIIKRANNMKNAEERSRFLQMALL